MTLLRRIAAHGRLATCLVICAVAAATGCGGNGDDQSTGAATATGTGTQAQTSPDAQVENPATHQMDSEAGHVSSQPSVAAGRATDRTFLRASFDSSADMWRGFFAAANVPFRQPHLVFFHDQVDTPCGVQDANVGPFYCPAGDGVYLNTDFFAALARRFGLHSGFAAGYIVAHEMGHHVQNVLGVLGRVHAADAQDPAGANRRSVAIELQADCYAGVWLHYVAESMTADDIQQVLTAAAVVGDDFQRASVGAELAPETWTHGSSEQRVHWLSVGKSSGTPASCDTFAPAQTR